MSLTEEAELRIANDVLQDFPADALIRFTETPFKDLIAYHNSLGRMIRNEYGLWQNEWEPVMIEGADHSEQHPDAISMRIIQKIHQIVNGDEA